MGTLTRPRERSSWGGFRGGQDVDVAAFKSVWEEKRLLGRFNYRYRLTRWLESPRLSTASIGSNDRAPSATPSDSSDFPSSSSAGRRPVSLISTLSSGSGSSRDDIPAAPGGGGADTAAPPAGEDIDLDLDLSPAPPGGEGDPGGTRPDAGEPAGGESTFRGGKFLQRNNNNNSGSSSGATFRSKIMAPNPQLTYLDRVVMELIETERMYVRDLRMIVEDYLAHIIDQADLAIRPEQVCALFGNIEDIYEFNSELLQALDRCDSDPVAIAVCFVDKSEYFEIYTQYCTNYPNSVAALTDCMRNKSLAKFFRERQVSLKRSLPLGSYLLKPVQRILKYHLLLQEIAKHFDPEEEGYEVVEEAIYTMTGVAWYINDMKRKHEHQVRLQEVQSLLLNWKGHDLTTFGELVLEGTFKVHRAKNERTLFLFDRMLLITKRRGEHYVYKAHISCSTLMLIESAKDSLCFSVTHYKHPKQPHTVQAKTDDERKLWAHHIKRIILENHQAIIPQKAKEAILEMESIYPSKYRYSPERVKRAMSSDEFLRDGCQAQGRRRSEPTKQILKNAKAILKDEEGDSIPEENGCDQENGQLLSQGALCGNEPQHNETQDKLLHRNTVSEPSEGIEPAPTSDPDSSSATTLKTSMPPREAEAPAGQMASPSNDKPAPASPGSDSKTLSSGESSDDGSEEDEEKGAESKGSEANSILPSSVLDKASAIAQHFTNSTRRGSLATEDPSSLGFSSPRLPSRTGSTLSLGGEPNEKSQWLTGASSEPQENFDGTDFTLLSQRDDAIFDSDRGSMRRRDSTLSKQDQLLIGKIKSYYEIAESEDANFSLKRRESLTYIPTGLVSNSVSRFNNIPSDNASAAERNHCSETVQTYASALTTSSIPDPSMTEPVPAKETPGHMVSNEKTKESGDSGFNVERGLSAHRMKGRSRSMQEQSVKDEDFRPSSEMIKIWQAMERESSGASRGLPSRNQTPNKNSEKNDGESFTILEESYLSTITEESTSPSPHKVFGVKKESLKNTLNVSGDERMVLRAPVPRVIQLRAEAEGEPTSEEDDAEKAKNKVLHLARQYSQRIKTTKPVVRQRNQDGKTLPCLIEEKESSGKPNLALVSCDEVTTTTTQLSPVERVRSPSPARSAASPLASPRVPSPSRARSKCPLSPSPGHGFNWPDVRELRSKYVLPPVARSLSVPERMLDSCPKRRSSCSSSFVLSHGSVEVPSYRPHLARDSVLLEERRARLRRARSLWGIRRDDVPNDGDYYISAEASLPSDAGRKIVVVEKLPQSAAERAGVTEEAGEEDDNYVQIRSPTSRDKISIMAVIDRCRAYQESDEYKQREEAGARTEAVLSGGTGKELDKGTASSDQQPDGAPKTNTNSSKKADASQQSNVKNLREKFQKLR